jgi:pimeloyl-ACP methyl ester carboxylesterase
MRLKSTEVRPADWPEGRQTAPDRTGSVRGLTRRSFHRIAFTDWGPASAVRPVLCVHGLTRNGRDFDHLAAVLASAGRRVICPDLPGRGQSERLHDSSDYALPQYCSDMTVLMAALGATEVDWVGTSLGGLIGMVLAALPVVRSVVSSSTISDRICPGPDCFASAPISTMRQSPFRRSNKPKPIIDGFWHPSGDWRMRTGGI